MGDMTTAALIQSGQQLASQIASLVGLGGYGGHSPWYLALKTGEAQNEVSKQMAQWNMENITQPVFQMENEEWQRRFNEQNTEWERQWNLQNQYNDPAAQMARLMSAGINPAMYGIQDMGQTAAPGQVGSPSVNEAASAFAEPANLAQIMQANAQDRISKAQALAQTMYAAYEGQMAIKQSIDNLTESDFRKNEIAVMGMRVKVGDSESAHNWVRAWAAKGDMEGTSAQGRLLLKQAEKISQDISESIARANLLYQQKQNAIKEGEILGIQEEWMPFEKYVATAEGKARTKKALQEAGLAGWQIGLVQKKMETEVMQAKLLGKQADAQEIANWSLQSDWQMKVDYQNKVYPKVLEYQGEQLSVDTRLYGEIADANLLGKNIDNTIGTALKVVGAWQKGLDQALEGYALYLTKGGSSLAPKSIWSTPGYNTKGIKPSEPFGTTRDTNTIPGTYY